MTEKRRISPVVPIISAALLGLAAAWAFLFLEGEPEEPEPPPPPPPPPPDQANIYGLITDAGSGAPVVGAELTFYQDLDTGTEIYKATTNEWGHYEITNMVADINAEFVVYAGGYDDLTGSVIPQGNYELNLTMNWTGGEHTVPRFIDYSIFEVGGYESPIMSGMEFPASIKIWLPYQEFLFRARLTLFSQDESVKLWLDWALLEASIYDALENANPGYPANKGFIRHDREGEYLLETMALAMYRERVGFQRYETLPLPPGMYDVGYSLTRTLVKANGRLEYIETEWEASAIVGAIEVVHPIGYGGLRGTVTDAETGEPLSYVKVASTISDRTHADGKYRLVWMSPAGNNFSVELSKFGYEPVIRNFRLNQGWTEINVAMSRSL